MKTMKIMKKLILFLLPGVLLCLIACAEPSGADADIASPETTTVIETTTEAETMIETETTTVALSMPVVPPSPTIPTPPITAPPPGATAFSLGFQVNTGARTQGEDGAVIIDSKQALNEFYAQYGDVNQALDNHLAPYNDAWFSTKKLIIITRTEGSGSIRHTAENLIVKDGTATAMISRGVPEIGTADMAYWVIALEVQSSDIPGATQARAVYFD